jgi:hypothetical protein
MSFCLLNRANVLLLQAAHARRFVVASLLRISAIVAKGLAQSSFDFVCMVTEVTDGVMVGTLLLEEELVLLQK